jgi:hypothetical protein
MPSISTCSMTTSNQPDAVAERVSALPRLPRDAGGPVFAEPWQAQAFALADELEAADDRGAKGLTNREAMRKRKEVWRQAYLHTPHGRPIELRVGVPWSEPGLSLD